MRKTPRTCGECVYRQKINPEENKCLLDNHVFDDTLSILTERRDRKCPYDAPKPSESRGWCERIRKRFGI